VKNIIRCSSSLIIRGNEEEPIYKGSIIGLCMTDDADTDKDVGACLVGKHTVYRMYAQTADEKEDWMQSIRYSRFHTLLDTTCNTTGCYTYNIVFGLWLNIN